MRKVQSRTGAKITRVGSATDGKSDRSLSSLLGQSHVNVWPGCMESDTNSYRSEFVLVSCNSPFIFLNMEITVQMSDFIPNTVGLTRC